MRCSNFSMRERNRPYSEWQNRKAYVRRSAYPKQPRIIVQPVAVANGPSRWLSVAARPGCVEKDMFFEELNDDEWARLAPLATEEPVHPHRRGRPRAEPRAVANAVVW